MIRWAALLCVVVFVFVTPAVLVAHTGDLVGSVHSDVASHTNVSAATDVQGFVTGSSASLPAMSDRERGHLGDVRRVMYWAEVVAWVSGLVVFVVMIDAPSVLRMAGHVSAALFVVAGISVTWWFDTTFYVVHEALFRSGSYVFSPDARLIQLFPATFFERLGSVCVLGSALITSSYYALSVILRR